MHGFTEARWKGLWNYLNAREDPKIVFDDVKRKYAAPPRVYHTVQHVSQCLKDLDGIRNCLEEPFAVELALILHDVEETEQRSVEYLIRVAEYGKITREIVKTAIGIVLAMDHRIPYTDQDKRYAMDIDLAVLGQSVSLFDRYDAQIREEFKRFSDEEYARGRKEKLQFFLDRPCGIYFTEHFRKRYEAQARSNLARAIARL
jgi:predicted metal-dependent HD superfamily phosphohydrolase